MTLERFLIIGAILFSIGLYGVLTKKHAISILMCLELMFNGVNLSAVAISRYTIPYSMVADPNHTAISMLTGHVFTVFIITVAAAEVALGLAIVIAVYRSRHSILVTDATQMKK